ncbi:Tryptophan synthase alpha chain [Sandaracinus amylolyticus]|uniref:Tryptophan synthase alpha chain n=2 Tax=Sandaracinus amylolyticus TaxID=927083 RepID=A0A0F6W8C4_9BACT|nr:Tryptophan synthase alpha chain [Sandaracinus amylolyticus]
MRAAHRVLSARRMHVRSIVVVLALASHAVASSPARADTYRVGPSRSYRQLSELPALAPGDVVEVDGGAIYEPASFETPGADGAPIVLRGIPASSGELPVLEGGDNTLELAADHYLVEGFEIRGGTRRCVFVHAHDLTLRNLRIHDCVNHGIEGGGGGGGDLTLEFVEVYRSGEGTQHHQIYVSSDTTQHPGSVFRMRFCYVHDGRGGNNVKSRSERNEIHFNWIEGALYHELELIGPDPDDAGVDEDDAIENSDVVGNVLVKGGGHSGGWITRIGGDGTGQTWGRYRFVNNTMVLASDSSGVFRVFTGLDSLEAHGNLIVSRGASTARVVRDVEAEWLSGTAQLHGSNNWVMDGLGFVPTSWTGTLRGSDPGLESLAENDLRPREGSALIDAAIRAPTSPAGFAFPGPLAVPTHHPGMRAHVAPGAEVSRPDVGDLDIGAFEHGAGPPVMTPDAGTMSMPDAGSACVPSCGARECGTDGCGGTCGRCGPREACSSAGTCECDDGASACGGACVDTRSSPDHCGGCDVACEADEVCAAGACASECGGSLVACDRACVDTTRDRANCGACGNACDGACEDGACVVTGRVEGGCGCRAVGATSGARAGWIVVVLAGWLWARRAARRRL